MFKKFAVREARDTVRTQYGDQIEGSIATYCRRQHSRSQQDAGGGMSHRRVCGWASDNANGQLAIIGSDGSSRSWCTITMPLQWN